MKIVLMDSLQSGQCNIYFGDGAYGILKSHLDEKEYSSVFILTDSNTAMHCLPMLMDRMPGLVSARNIEIPQGETNKNLQTCLQVWNTLSEQGADRHSLLINLGGGVVTDLGGFVASTYQRGISFVNIPTSLLAMVDASVGGKTGVDLGALKNQIGVIENPELVLIDGSYLATLDARQRRSGFAEMLKHGLIRDRPYWDSLKTPGSLERAHDSIFKSVQLKNEVVMEDPKEGNLRKILNFGHTLGHAIESYFLESGGQEALLHGEAIAVGMVLEAFLSTVQSGLPMEDCEEIKKVILHVFPRVEISVGERDAILKLLRFDKKNTGGAIRFSLLEQIGKACYNQEVTADQLHAAFEYYKN